MSAPPDGVRREHPLARLTTIRTGGDAERIEVGVAGSGSNLLVADEGVRGLVLELDRDLSHTEQHGDRLQRGGGAVMGA